MLPKLLPCYSTTMSQPTMPRKRGPTFLWACCFLFARKKQWESSNSHLWESMHTAADAPAVQGKFWKIPQFLAPAQQTAWHLQGLSASWGKPPASGNHSYQQSSCVWSQKHLQQSRPLSLHRLSKIVYALGLKQLNFVFFLRAQWHLVVLKGGDKAGKRYVKTDLLQQ